MEIRLHKNARTTPKIREYIQQSKKSNVELAEELGIHVNTVSKWKNRKDVHDRSHTRHNLNITLSCLEEEIISYLRKEACLGIDDITHVMQECVRDSIKRGAVYRCLKRLGINKPSEEEKPKKTVGQFDEEDNKIGFIHIDVKYIYKGAGSEFKKHGGEGKYYYLYVGIDRATRYVYVSLKEDLNGESSSEFLKEFAEYFPHKIRVILTDNGSEFTDRFMNEMKDKDVNKPSGKHEFDKLCKEMEIERRYTKPFKPQTNGMVERFNRRVNEWIKQKGKNINGFQYIKEYIDNMVNNYNNTKLRVIDYHTPLQLLRKHNHKTQNTT